MGKGIYVLVAIVRTGGQVNGMSNDLISREALLEKFTISDSGRRIPEYDIDNFPVTITVKDVKDIIRKEPIAFDKEKAINKIRNMPHGYYNTEIKNEIVEIIEKGGIK